MKTVIIVLVAVVVGYAVGVKMPQLGAKFGLAA